MEALVLGGVISAVTIVGFATYYLRRWLAPRGYERQPQHVSQTAEGAKRHADRMAGLRALAEGIDADLPPEQDQAAAPAAKLAEKPAAEPAKAEVDAGW